ncbi:MAG: hypothetical protein LBP53_05390 [Candidatus Peribacteria bacterium]|nr:hypothetical protein [Candidatus Peribacteria bacterium]
MLLDQITTTNDVAKKNLKSCKKLIERENLEPLEYIKKYESFGNHLSFLLLDDIETNPKNLENLEKIAKIYLDIANYIGDERIKQRASTIVNSINNLNIKK